MSERRMGRTGVLARKVGMTRIFDEAGNHVPVTVLSLEENQVVARRTVEGNGYTALQIGAGEAKVSRASKPNKGHFAKAGVSPKQKLVEFRVAEDALLDVGVRLCAAHFAEGQYVDVRGISNGKGFAGGMKRWGFGGLRASHGVSVSHRSLGSTGQCQDPGRVFKGKKMAGHMGARNVTAQSLRVVGVDVEDDLILVRGAVPGPKQGWVQIEDAMKRPVPEAAPWPAGVVSAAKEDGVDNLVSGDSVSDVSLEAEVTKQEGQDEG